MTEQVATKSISPSARRDAGLFRALSGNYLTEVVQRLPQMLGDAWILRVLTPAEYGIWTTFRLWLQTLATPLGIFLVGLEYRYPALAGANDDVGAENAYRHAAWISICLGMIGGLGILGLSATEGMRRRFFLGASFGECAALAGLVGIQFFYNSLVTHSRVRLAFLRVNAALVAGSVVGTAVLIAVSGTLRVYGAALAFALTLVTSCSCLLHSIRPLFARGASNDSLRAHLRPLTTLGVSLTLCYLELDALRLLSRWTVSSFGDPIAMGKIGVGAVFGSIVFLGGTSGSRALGPILVRMQARSGASSGDATRVFHITTLAIALTAACSCIGAWFLASYGLPILAVEKATALDILRPCLYGAMSYATIFTSSTYVRSQGRFGALMVLLLVCLGAYAAALGGLVLWGDHSVHGVVSLEAVALFLVMIAVTVFAAGRGQRAFVATIVILYATAAAALESYERFADAIQVSGLVRASVGMATCLTIMGIVTALLTLDLKLIRRRQLRLRRLA